MTGKQRGNMRKVVSVEPTEDPENGAPREKLTLACGHVVIRASRICAGFKHRRVYCPYCGLPPEKPVEQPNENPCRCVDCGGFAPSHDPACLFMRETFGDGE